jgi:hypothetical protein
LSAKTIWGKIVLFLKEHRQVALHVACGDITDVELNGNSLVVNVYEGMLVKLLEEGKKELESAMRWQGLDLNIVVNVKSIEKSKEEQDKEKLKEIFGEYLIVKGDIKNGI